MTEKTKHTSAGVAGAVSAVILIVGLWWAFGGANAQEYERRSLEQTKNGLEVLATGLDTPWEIIQLPEGDLLVSERPGFLKRIDSEGDVQEVAHIEQAEEIGEGGLLGIAIHPNFEENTWLYMYYTYRTSTGGIENRIVRAQYEDGALGEEEIILDELPGSLYHNGGRIAFGPDGYLYATVGDARETMEAQKTNSLAGSILRISDEGEIPDDNPFANAIYSYGHRNPQGLAWDENDQLWATEHGRSGLLSGYDEINRINLGENYGWPIIQGDESLEGMQAPIAQSGPDITWAPAGAVIVGQTLYFVGLRGEAIYTLDLRGGRVTAHFQGEFGRIRSIVLEPGEESVLIGTSNRDQRGDPQEQDDQIIRIPLSDL